MTRQKSVAVAFLGGALLVGGLLGFTADRLVLRAGCERQWDQRQLRTRLAEDLSLDAGQRATVDEILDRRTAGTRAVIAPIQPQLDSVMQVARGAIRAILTPEQREKFEAMVREADSADARRKAARDTAIRGKATGGDATGNDATGNDDAGNDDADRADTGRAGADTAARRDR